MKKYLLLFILLFFSSKMYSQQLSLSADLEVTNDAPNRLKFRMVNYTPGGVYTGTCDFGNTSIFYGEVFYEIYKNGVLVDTVFPTYQYFNGVEYVTSTAPIFEFNGNASSFAEK